MFFRRKIVAFSLWQYPYRNTPEQAKAKEEKEARAKLVPHPEGTNVALTKEFFKKLHEGRKKWVDPEKMYCKFGHVRLSYAGLFQCTSNFPLSPPSFPPFSLSEKETAQASRYISRPMKIC